MKSMLRVAFPSLVLLLLGACAGTKNTAPAEVLLNDKCPVSGHEVDASCTKEYMGGKVGFCCEKCVTKWDGMDDAAKKQALAAKK